MSTSKTIGFAASLLTLAIGTAMAAEPQAGIGAAQGAALAAARTGTDTNRNEIDPKALDRAQQKFAQALKLTHNFDAQAKADGLGNDNWRHELLANLMKIDEGDFAVVASATAVNDALGTSTRIAGIAKPPGTANSLGQATQDLTYIPIAPCRILDTRKGTGTSFSAGQTRTYSFSSTNTGNGNCVVYSAYSGTQMPKAIAANVTVDATAYTGYGPGNFLSIYPQGGSAGTSFLNYGAGAVVANAGVITINETNGQFNVFASAAAQVIIDVFGVFVPPAPTALECTTAADSRIISPGSAWYIAFPACPSGYSRTAGYCDGPGGGSPGQDLMQTGPNDCGFRNTSSGPYRGTSTAQCCRVPGRN